MNKLGIICIETEWEHTEWHNRLPIQTKPLLEFVEKAYNCPTIYRRVATFSELKYYLGQFNKPEYDDYRIFYLSFHGDTQIIQLEGEPGRYKTLTLEELSSKTTSLASFVISEPLPIAIPISACLIAGASLTPSPVTATTSPISLSNVTILSLVLGVLRATTLTNGNRDFNFSSESPSNW